jgi:hypothetical protein
LCHDPGVVDDRDPVGDTLRLLHGVRGEKHRQLLVTAQRADESQIWLRVWGSSPLVGSSRAHHGGEGPFENNSN